MKYLQGFSYFVPITVTFDIRKGVDMPVRGKSVIATVMVRDTTVQDHRDTVAQPGRFVSVTGKGVVSSGIKNYAAYPFFVRKAAEAKAEIDKVGLPKSKKEK